MGTEVRVVDEAASVLRSIARGAVPAPAELMSLADRLDEVADRSQEVADFQAALTLLRAGAHHDGRAGRADAQTSTP